jgi:ABC-type nitrate/sulfonate/bicarbonate transport system substrate-binding protein
MMKVRVGGVPEHFNLAWHLAIEQHRFSNHHIDIQWNDITGGTGAMCKALRNNELDIAIALTEGVVSDIMAGNPSKIVQFYVNSPLTWGIYVNAQSAIIDSTQIQNCSYAISRFNSGSHLMAYVNAQANNLSLKKSDFVVVGNLDGAREALKNNTAQLFMWEKFTTKPLVDSGEFRKIGECRTPWPCFVIAVRNEFIEHHEELLMTILNTINLSCLVLKNNSHSPALIAERYGIKLEDAMEWFKDLEYAYNPEINEQEMVVILKALHELNIIDHIPQLNDICFEKNVNYID